MKELIFRDKDRGKLMAAFAAEARREKQRLARAKIEHDGCSALIGEDKDFFVALKELIGGTITDAGVIPGNVEGSIAFDYLKDGKQRRLVIGYNDLGGWVQFAGEIQQRRRKKE